MSGELWRCPECRRQFVNTNQWHSCLELALDEHLGGHTPEAVALYRAFQAAVEDCGEFRIHPQKTRIAFIAAMSFAGATLARRWIDVRFITSRAVDDPRIRRIQLYGPTSFAHTIRIHSIDDIDAALRSWLCEAWTRGTQATLDSTARVPRVVGHARSVLTVPLTGRVVSAGEDLLLTLPAHAIDAIGLGELVTARIPGTEPAAAQVTDRGLRFHSDLLRSLGFGAGDDCDVFIEPA